MVKDQNAPIRYCFSGLFLELAAPRPKCGVLLHAELQASRCSQSNFAPARLDGQIASSDPPSSTLPDRAHILRQKVNAGTILLVDSPAIGDDRVAGKEESCFPVRRCRCSSSQVPPLAAVCSCSSSQPVPLLLSPGATRSCHRDLELEGRG